MSTGQRWYLVAYDLGREDWRTFRVDRVTEPLATGVRFAPRELPAENAAEYLRRSIRPRRQETYGFEVWFAGSAETVSSRVPAWVGVPEAEGDGGGCVLRGSSGDPVEWLAVRLAMVGCEFTVRMPDELAQCVRELGGRLSRAGARTGTGKPEGN